MIIKDLLSILALGLTSVGMSTAASARDADPLFADDSILTAKLVAPLEQIMEARTSDQQFPGTFELHTSDGSSVQVAVQVRARGNYRRSENVCKFAPLRLNYKKSEVTETALDNQDKLKLITHCQDHSTSYEQAVIKEYLVYRMLNVITDVSFRVRLLRITYVDSDSGDSEDATFAVLIESDKRLAKRLNMDELEAESVRLQELDRDYTNLASVYEYMIGNLDFSPVAARDGNNCCHNSALFVDGDKTNWSVPYDFDMSGFVEAPHAGPNPKYKQRSVRTRIYRGRCYNQELVPATLQKFREKRTDIEAVVATHPELRNGVRRRVLGYIEMFYELMEKEEKLLEEFAEDCI